MTSDWRIRALRKGYPIQQRKVEPVIEVAWEPDKAPPVDPMLELAKAITLLAQREVPAPIIHVHVPEQPAPQVSVTTPEVVIPQMDLSPRIVVKVPEQPAPVVNVTTPDVTVNTPAVQDIRIVSSPRVEAEVTRDHRGRVTGIVKR